MYILADIRPDVCLITAVWISASVWQGGYSSCQNRFLVRILLSCCISLPGGMDGVNSPWWIAWLSHH